MVDKTIFKSPKVDLGFSGEKVTWSLQLRL